MLYQGKIEGSHIRRQHSIISCNSRPPDSARDHLEDHLMGVLTLGQTPASFQIFGKIVRLFDSLKNGLVNVLLICRPSRWQCFFGLWFPSLEELLLC